MSDTASKGAKATDNAALIVEAVNRFDALTAVAEAARVYVMHYGYPERGIDSELDAVSSALADLDAIK